MKQILILVMTNSQERKILADLMFELFKLTFDVYVSNFDVFSLIKYFWQKKPDKNRFVWNFVKINYFKLMNVKQCNNKSICLQLLKIAHSMQAFF